jgi:hypothetical protein
MEAPMGNMRFAAFLLFLLLTAAAADSDVTSSDATVETSADAVGPSTPEPVTGTPVQPAPGSETIQKNPFEPYGIGPPEEAVPYSALSPAEQAVVDRGRDASAYVPVHDAFAEAVRERSKQARAEAAAHELGVDSLATIGVVP